MPRVTVEAVMQPPVALRYMLDFQCAGQACEDTCCGGWEIEVGQGPYAKIKRALEKDSRAGLAPDPSQLLQLVPPEQRTRERFAVIRQAEAGHCPLLDEQRLCSLQRRHGAELLPDGCALFPRVYRRVDGRSELTGTLSCPEVARRALLTDGATDLYELVDAELQGLPRPAEGDARVIGRVRELLYERMSRRDESFSTSLLFVTWAAYSTDALLAAGDEAALVDALDRFATPSYEAELAQHFSTIGRQRTDALPLVESVLERLVEGGSSPAFKALVEEARRSYADERSATPAASFAARRAAVLAAHGESIELYLRNYGRHYVVKHWPNNDGSLKRCLQGLLLRVAVIRFLLLSHPETAAASDRSALDKVAVRVIYSWSRHVEHSPSLLALLTQLGDHHLQPIEHAVSLIGL